jgi:hypothetical protein
MHETMPLSRTQWVRDFERSLGSFPNLGDNYYPSVMNIQVFVNAVQTWCDHYTQILSYLLNAKDNFIMEFWVPRKSPTGGTEKTQLSVFLNAFPHGVGPLLHRVLIQQEDKPEDMSAYIVLFLSALNTENDKCLQLFDFLEAITQWRKAIPTKPGNNYVNTHKLHNLDDVDYSEVDSCLDLLDNHLNYLSSTPVNNVVRGACYLMIVGKPCPLGVNCPHAHDKASLEVGRDRWIATVRAVKYSDTPPTPHRAPPAIPSRDRGFQRTDRVNALDSTSSVVDEFEDNCYNLNIQA